jgi:DNA-binding beta-propeller fold protein YncE
VAEQLANNAASTLTAAIPDAVATSCTVANGTVFPATGNFRIIVDSELMLCTARAANVLTVTRGVETTTAVAHANGAAVTHVLTKGGLDAYLADQAFLAAWTTYTPTWTANVGIPVIGNGTLAGRYLQIGKTVFFAINLTAGSTTTFGTAGNFWIFSLPVTASASAFAVGGSAYVEDAGTKVYVANPRFNTTTTIVVDQTNETTSGSVGSTMPFTWATGDILRLAAFYEVA